MKNCYFCKKFIYRVINPTEMSFMCLCLKKESDTMQGWLDDDMNSVANFECCEFDEEKLNELTE